MVSDGFALLSLLENKGKRTSTHHSGEAHEEMVPDYLNEQVLGEYCAERAENLHCFECAVGEDKLT
jgi:hypothetical protein